MGAWDQSGPYEDWLREFRLDPVGSGYGPVAGCCKYGDEPSCSDATELVIALGLNLSFITYVTFTQLETKIIPSVYILITVYSIESENIIFFGRDSAIK
jgi:hypothetical protein